MGKWDEVNDFSMYEGSLPCVLCKEESSRTLLGDHWKCSACAHVFNQDGSPIGVECTCDACQQEKHKNDPVEKGFDKLIKKIKKSGAKKPSKKKKKV